MARQKRNSLTIAEAESRCAGLAAINPALDLGNGLTLAAYKAEIKAAKELLEEYNTRLATLDAQKNELERMEDRLGTLSSRMLKGVSVAYGTNSDEYEKAGGTRDSERKRAGRKPAAAASVAVPAS